MKKGDRNILAAATVGMAFWWPLLRNSVVGFLFSSDRSSASWSQDGPYLFLALATIIALGASLSLRKGFWERRLNQAHGLAVGLLVCCAVASVLSGILVGFPEVLGVPAAIADVVVLATVYVILPLGWSFVLLGWFGESPKRLLLVTAASYAVSFLVGYLSYAPEPLSLIRPIGAPILSGLACYYCLAKGKAKAQQTPAPSLRKKAVGNGIGASSLYVLVLAVFLVGSVASGFINSGLALYAPSTDTFVRDTLNIVVTISLVALILSSKSLEHVKFTLAVVLTVLLFGGIVLATLFEQSWFTIGIGLVQTSKSCVSLLLLMLVLLGSLGRPYTVVARSALLKFVLPTLVSTFIGYLAVPFLARALGVAYSDFWGVLSLLLGLSLGVFLFGFLSFLVIRYLPRMELPASEGQTGPELIAAAMRRAYGLTEKEAEVLELILEGNTYKKIAALMYVSDSTVQSHAKSIYRKVDVHTKQELVDRAMELRGQRVS